MLQNILKINGVQKLDKNQKQSLSGGFGNQRGCYQNGAFCCSTASPSGPFCAAGRCGSNGCLFY